MCGCQRGTQPPYCAQLSAGCAHLRDIPGMLTPEPAGAGDGAQRHLLSQRELLGWTQVSRALTEAAVRSLSVIPLGPCMAYPGSTPAALIPALPAGHWLREQP